jgi:hypothetical protein
MLESLFYKVIPAPFELAAALTIQMLL